MTQDTDIATRVESIDGVAYTTFHGATFRVVFEHRASTSAVVDVVETVGKPGQIGATQEHLACVEFAAGETADLDAA